jgi:signal transduction histidine kinase/ActR/RegA family two-component response regulator
MPAGHLPVRSYLAVPVVTQSGEAIGALFFGHPARGVFSARAERLVMGMAAQAAVAIDNARLYDAVRRDAAERQSLLDRERRAREDAERATRLKDDFLATLSHELRTPLSAILGWSQLLRARPPSQNDLARGLEAVERNARTQLQLVEDLLDMSRIAAGKLRLELRLVDPAVVVEHAVESVALAAETKQIRIEKHFDADAGTVSGDPERLQQIVWNLLSNAVKFTPNGGHVHVSVRRAGEHAEIAVADSGIGIEPGYLGQVFERFRQVDGSAARRYGGLGLGLAIVRQLVDLHGGSVHVASGGANRGATFTVRLPVAAVHGEEEHGARAEPDVAETPAVAGADLRGARVLLVDDDPDGRELCGIVLEKHGAEVHTAAGAQQALAALEANAFHVLVSDIGMPGIDGYELLRRVRAMKGPAARVPAIALTAFAGPEDRARALRAGFRQHLTKPVAAEELARAVAKIVSAKPN